MTCLISQVYGRLLGGFKCFKCGSELEEPSAYVTKAMLPVCGRCLTILCERYSWGENNSKPKRLRRQGVEPMGRITAEEAERELSSIPVLAEGDSTSMPGGVRKLNLPPLPSLED